MLARPRTAGVLLVFLVLSLPGCFSGEPPQGEGPGHRPQELAMTPEQELDLGRRAYKEVLGDSQVMPKNSPQTEQVRRVGERIAKTVKNEPLMREINLRVKDYRFEWEFNALRDKHVNAFCLPGGKVAVFTGLLEVAEDDDQLAAVLGHEVAHALAHHSSERLARQEHEGGGLLAALREKKYDRAQESEADHIGLFLMTFAGYDPRQAVVFWKHMKEISDRRGQVPQILSDHPSDAQRIHDLEEWVPKALAAKKAYDAGRIAPGGGRRD